LDLGKRITENSTSIRERQHSWTRDQPGLGAWTRLGVNINKDKPSLGSSCSRGKGAKTHDHPDSKKAQRHSRELQGEEGAGLGGRFKPAHSGGGLLLLFWDSLGRFV
jgi:hypothetical protein